MSDIETRYHTALRLDRSVWSLRGPDGAEVEVLFGTSAEARRRCRRLDAHQRARITEQVGLDL